MNLNSTTSYRIYIEDTDMMGVVYHANYLRYFERARTELLRKHGLSLKTLAESGVLMTICDIHINYKKPLFLDDMISIKTELNQTRPVLFECNQSMYNQHNVCVCEAIVQMVSTNSHLKPRRLPQTWIETLLKPHHNEE